MTAVRSRTETVLARTREEGRPALIGYLPAGFPDLDTSIAAARTMLDAGVDVIELGLPYSDPVMDGPVIQRATTAALANGFRTRDVLTAVEQLSGGDAAILLMSYWNLVLAQGVDSFSSRLADVGGAGIITPDLIPDEADDWIAASDAHGLDRIFLVAPSSPRERLAYVASRCRGFVYAASTMGVTGARTSVSDQAEDLVTRTRAAGADFVCVGLGVSDGAQAAEVGRYADGVIVGSAFVRALADSPTGDLSGVRRVAEDLRAGIERARTGESA